MTSELLSQYGEKWMEAVAESSEADLTHVKWEDRPVVGGFALDKVGTLRAEQTQYVEQLSDGVFQVAVSIPDVGALIHVGSAAEEWAQTRMVSREGDKQLGALLPPYYQYDLLSLVGGQLRPSLTISYKVNEEDMSLSDLHVFRSAAMNSQNLGFRDFKQLVSQDYEDEKIGKIRDYLALGRVLSRREQLSRGMQPAPFGQWAANEWNEQQAAFYPKIFETVAALMSTTNEAFARYCVEKEGLEVLYLNRVDREADKELLPEYVQNDLYHRGGFGWINCPDPLGVNGVPRLKVTTPTRDLRSMINAMNISRFLEDGGLEYSYSDLVEIGRKWDQRYYDQNEQDKEFQFFTSESLDNLDQIYPDLPRGDFVQVLEDKIQASEFDERAFIEGLERMIGTRVGMFEIGWAEVTRLVTMGWNQDLDADIWEVFRDWIEAAERVLPEKEDVDFLVEHLGIEGYVEMYLGKDRNYCHVYVLEGTIDDDKTARGNSHEKNQEYTLKKARKAFLKSLVRLKLDGATD